ncbi:MAG TPA: molybdenum cofactor guanylyltransferase [Chthoniobacterales bacterium]|nr:molybdenum cofactor guanylyltransferase [Chthoniobacterales bacterium]
MNERTGESPITWSALLLAGGESRRMGRHKATMEFQGKPMWERQLQTLRDLAPQKILVSARTRPRWLPHDVELVLDDAPSRGPLSGVTKALAVMDTTHLIVLAVDMPFMTAPKLRELCNLVDEDRGVVPIIGERVEPLAAIYPATGAKEFRCALVGSDFSLRSLVQELAANDKVKVFPISAEESRFYDSVNEPGDLKEGRFPNRPSCDGGL